MSTLISTINIIGYISAIVGITFLIPALIKKLLYYPPNKREEAYEKSFKLMKISGSFITSSMICFFGLKAIIKNDFKTKLQKNKILSAEFNKVFLSENDAQSVFKNLKPTEGRHRCTKYAGTIFLDNSEAVPIEIIKHCYEKNRYILVSKEYDKNTDIGDIVTNKLDFILNDSIK